MIPHHPCCKDVDILCDRSFHLKLYLVSCLPRLSVHAVLSADVSVCWCSVSEEVVFDWFPNPHEVLHEGIEGLAKLYQIWSGKDASPDTVDAFVHTIVADGAEARRVFLVFRLVVLYVAIG